MPLNMVGDQNRIQISENVTAQGEGSVGIYLTPWNGNNRAYLALTGATVQAETAVYFSKSNALFILNDCRIDGDIIADNLSGVAFGGLWDIAAAELISLEPDFSFRFDDDIIGKWVGKLGTGELSLNGDAEFLSLTIHAPAPLKDTGVIHGPVIDSQRFYSQTGLKIEHSHGYEEMKLISQLAALWTHAFDDATAEHTQARLIDSEGHSPIQGRDSAQDSVELSRPFKPFS